MKAFSFFSGIGGSSQGYKEAGIDVIGACDIDKHQLNMYEKTFKPKYLLKKGIKQALDNDIDFLHKVDLFDGSPPCTNFTVHNIKRHKYQFKAKNYHECFNKKQIIEELVLDYFKVVVKYKPNYFVLENVSNIYKEYKPLLKYYIYLSNLEEHYYLHFFVLNSYKLGLHTSRDRFFLIGIKRNLKNFNFDFKAKQEHALKDIWHSLDWQNLKQNEEQKCSTWNRWQYLSKNPSKNVHGYKIINENDNYIPAITTKENNVLHPHKPKALTAKCLAKIQGLEHDFKNIAKSRLQYMVGMSVPPVFTKEIGKQILENGVCR